MTFNGTQLTLQELILYVANSTDHEALADSEEFYLLQELNLTNAIVLATVVDPLTASQFWYNYNEASSYQV